MSAPISVGWCPYCEEPVVFERDGREAKCPCGRSTVPAEFFRLAAIQLTAGQR